MLSTHRDAEKRYNKIRDNVVFQLNKEYAESGEHNFNAKLFDQYALDAAAEWGYSEHRRVDWNWFKCYSAFKFRYPKRFELALWHKDVLASLALGRPTYNGTHMRLDMVEACPDKPKDLSVIEKNLVAFAIYAEMLGATELRIMNPINRDVRSYYSRFGLAYDAIGDYMVTRL